MANVVEAVKSRVAERSLRPVDERVVKSVEQSEAGIRGDEPVWQLALNFYGNDQHTFISAVTNEVDRMETREGGEKPASRMRLTRNRMSMQVASEVSMLGSRTPSYEATAPNQDPKRINAARLSEQVLLAERERLRLDVKDLDVILYAVLTGAGFVWPHWDGSGGTYLGEEGGQALYEGEIGYPVYHQSEVLWEAGVAFDDSDWVCVRKAQAVSKVKRRQGYIGSPELKPDRKEGKWKRVGSSSGELVMVYDYLEKPCQEHPAGRWLTYAGKNLILEPRDYPRRDGLPVVHKLPWLPRPNEHRDLGAGEQLVDVQRSWNRTLNQIMTWKNLVLVPQMMAPVGSLQTDPTNESGTIWEYRAIGGLAPEWREVPEIPVSLFKMLDLCLDDFNHILGMRDLPSGVESGTGIEQVNERDMSGRAMFVKQLARFFADVGYHVLDVVHENYTEPRLLEVQGRFGVELIEDFVGTKIGRPGTVRVSTASIEPRTKAGMEARIMGYAERGWIPPHQAMAAINGGSSESLVDDFELDVARQYREINDLIYLSGWDPDERMERALSVAKIGEDGALPESITKEIPQLPMAQDYDNHIVHMDLLKQWMKTREFELLPEIAQLAARHHLSQHMQLDQQEQMQQAQMQMMKAEGLGMANASRDQGLNPGASPASQGTLAAEMAGKSLPAGE